MKSLTIPRARRPLNARVMAVVPGRVSAWRCGALVPASGQRMNAVPICAATAPAASDAAMPGPSAIPPEATSGSSVTAAREPQQAEQPELAASVEILERAAVTAGLDPLADQRIGTNPGREHGLVGLGDRHPHGAARGPAAPARSRGRGSRT